MKFEFKDHHGFSAYALFASLKIHFTSASYDYFKYHGKTNISESTFEKRKDKYSFYKLSRKYNLEQLKDYYVSNFLDGDVRWVGSISGPEGEEVYKKWQTRIQRLTYQFEQDIITLFDVTESPEEMLQVVDGQHPLLLTETMAGTVTIETLVILNDIMNFFPMWTKKIKDDIVWPNWKLKVEKYTPFLNYDIDKFRYILKEKLKEYYQFKFV